jgi:hypothetical protein
MLELSNAKLELVQIVPRNEVQIFDEAPQEPHRLLAGARPGAAHARGKLAEQFLEGFDDAWITGHGRAASTGAADGASRVAPAPPAPTVSP